MDQDEIGNGIERRQPLQPQANGFLSRGAAGDRFRHPKPLHRSVVKLTVGRLDHYLYGIDGIVAKKCADRMVQHGAAPQILILFGAVSAKALAGAGGDDQRHT
ncbi:hypothetical protein SAE02_51910 [Skermanella aerolata]|uniref:Uncharacterized protein n=1 Tax=Skermanella aerolata TaxID=393310 RepID=A0A512DX46_9PROT|nr:hypothetical protein SAE02_51910 [Skermanella aerolata]